MSNGAELKATVWDQESRVRELVRERLRGLDYYSRILQGIIADDEIIVRPKLQAATETFHLVSNFRSAQEAVDAGQYEVKWGLADRPTEIPMIIQPVDCLVRAVSLGRVMTTEQVYSSFFRMADPVKLLTLGWKFPEEQRKNPIFAVCLDAAGRFCYAILGVGRRGRNVNVNRDKPDDKWNAHVRVLVCE